MGCKLNLMVKFNPPRSSTQGVLPERDGNYDKLESVQPQEETLMSTLQFGIKFSY